MSFNFMLCQQAKPRHRCRNSFYRVFKKTAFVPEQIVSASVNLVLHPTAGCCHLANLVAYSQYFLRIFILTFFKGLITILLLIHPRNFTTTAAICHLTLVMFLHYLILHKNGKLMLSPLSSVSDSEKNQFWRIWSDCEPVVWLDRSSVNCF